MRRAAIRTPSVPSQGAIVIPTGTRAIAMRAISEPHSATRIPVTKYSVSPKQEVGIHLCCS